jgi:hypothetical protein
MNKKPQPDLHEKALKVFAVIKRTDKEQKAADTVFNYSQRRKEEIANHILPVLKDMDAAFNRGETIGGATSLKQWCKAYKSFGALTYARCRQILTGKSGNEGRKTRLRVDQVVMIGKREVKLTGMMLEAVLSYVEPGHPVKSLDPAPVTHAKYSARKTLCMANMPNRKLKGKVFAENWDAATCPDCVRYNERKKARLAPKTLTVVVSEPTEHMKEMMELGRRARIGHELLSACGNLDGDDPMEAAEECRAELDGTNDADKKFLEEPPQGTPQHVIDRVAEIKSRAALGLPQGDTCPGNVD